LLRVRKADGDDRRQRVGSRRWRILPYAIGSVRPRPGTGSHEIIALDRPFAACGKLPSMPPARIFVITASESDVAVIFRRGPSDWFHLLKWDMSTDVFEAGAWFKGTMYPERSDLSPDGTLLLYFALQGSRLQTSYTHAWTAVSRAPWIEALGLWPQGMTYGGGGRFVSNRHVVLRANNASPHEGHPGIGLEVELGNPPAHASSGEIDGATWSGRDRRGRLIFAKDGKLFREGLGKIEHVRDLDGMRPEPLPTPAWASRAIDAA
jgi:hypothetical protein